MSLAPNDVAHNPMSLVEPNSLAHGAAATATASPEDRSAFAPLPLPSGRPDRSRMLRVIICSGLAVVLGICLVVTHQRWQAGTCVTVEFQSAHGLRPGASVVSDGVVIGRVTAVERRANGPGVTVSVSLSPNCRSFASAGSQYYITRPTISFNGVQGLDTIVGDIYLAVCPGSGNEVVTEFVGAEEPPLPEPTAGSLNISIRAERRSFAMRRGAPVSYRGMPIGMIRSVALTEDGSCVRIQVCIEPAYAKFVTTNAKFVESEVLRFQAGNLIPTPKLDLLAVQGGLELEVPRAPGVPAVSGKEFDLAHKS